MPRFQGGFCSGRALSTEICSRNCFHHLGCSYFSEGSIMPNLRLHNGHRFQGLRYLSAPCVPNTPRDLLAALPSCFLSTNSTLCARCTGDYAPFRAHYAREMHFFNYASQMLQNANYAERNASIMGLTLSPLHQPLFLAVSHSCLTSRIFGGCRHARKQRPARTYYPGSSAGP